MGRDPNTPGPRLLLVIAPPPRKDEPVKSARREPANGILQCTHVCPDSNLWIAQLRGFGAAERRRGNSGRALYSTPPSHCRPDSSPVLDINLGVLIAQHHNIQLERGPLHRSGSCFFSDLSRRRALSCALAQRADCWALPGSCRARLARWVRRSTTRGAIPDALASHQKADVGDGSSSSRPPGTVDRIFRDSVSAGE